VFQKGHGSSRLTNSQRAREILHVAAKKGVTIIGPATVGGIKPGAFKIGNTGGMMDNIVASKLYRSGAVSYVSKSGGMSNELNNIIEQTTNGVCEGVAIGGDRYPGTTFIDHMLRYEQDPNTKILLLLGEVGGVEEYRVIEAVKNGTITKPIVAWAIGTVASMLKTEVQFGHAGSFANSQLETAAMKNKSMKEAGFYVPDTFEDMPKVLADLYKKLTADGTIKPQSEPAVPKIPIDYSWAQELGLIRKPAAFISTISDDRGQELLYAGMPISDVFKENIGIGGVMSLLWFRRRLPDYASKFLEMVLMLTADHGPAVSGAMNTIITTRAGKDLISSLVAGLLTIGSRFGGALDGAAEEFTKAYDKGLSPRDFVDTMRKENKLIPGIGHRVKSRNNPDLRVSLVKEYVKANFPRTPLLDYALAVESVTTSKKDNLILNVDGAVAVAFVDLVRGCGAFTNEEAEDYLKMGVLNGLFVLGRSIGLIAHFLDQKRLRTGLYRHPWVSSFVLAHLSNSILIPSSRTTLPTSSPACPAAPLETRAVSRSPCEKIDKNDTKEREGVWGCLGLFFSSFLFFFYCHLAQILGFVSFRMVRGVSFYPVSMSPWHPFAKYNDDQRFKRLFSLSYSQLFLIVDCEPDGSEERLLK
jgi:citrate synthase